MFGKSNNTEIKSALQIIKQAAAGNFEVRITDIQATGDVKEFLYTVNDLIDRCDAYVRESSACMDHVSRNKYFRKIIETSMEGAFLGASQTVNSALGAMHKKVEDFCIIADNFEQNVGSVVETVSSAATELSSSSESMQRIASDSCDKATAVASAAEQTSINVQTVSAASEELTASISEISQQISSASRMSDEATKVSESVSKQVATLKEAADQIKNAVILINDIADQTNLLALNATIEAARAGESGKGFAVVASEVKNLAQQTSKATDEIGSYVTGIENAMQDTIDGIVDVAKKVSEINHATASVSAAVEEQSAATGEIARNIEQASIGTSDVTSNISGVMASSQETGDAATEVNSAASELSSQSENLRTSVGEFLFAVRKVV